VRTLVARTLQAADQIEVPSHAPVTTDLVATGRELVGRQ